MPNLIIIGGPNGAGKTTFARPYVRELGYDFLGAQPGAQGRPYGRLFSLMGFSSYVFFRSALPLGPSAPRAFASWRTPRESPARSAFSLRSFFPLCVPIIRRLKSEGNFLGETEQPRPYGTRGGHSTKVWAQLGEFLDECYRVGGSVDFVPQWR